MSEDWSLGVEVMDMESVMSEKVELFDSSSSNLISAIGVSSISSPSSSFSLFMYSKALLIVSTLHTYL